MTRFALAIAALFLAIAPRLAVDGQPAMHDPSTVIEAGGKFYVYSTGNGLPAFASDDGWTWRRTGSVMQAVPGGKPGPDVIARGGNNTWAPDIIRSGDKYFLYYAAPGTQPKAAVGLLVGRTLDPASPDYTWEDAGPVVWSDGVEDSNAIDPGVMCDPTNGTWIAFEAAPPWEPATVFVAPLKEQVIPESEWVVVERFASHPFWSADGTILYYTPTGTIPMVRSTVRGRRFVPGIGVLNELIAVYSSVEMLMPAYLPGTAPIATPDQIILVLGDFRGDVWLMDLSSPASAG